MDHRGTQRTFGGIVRRLDALDSRERPKMLAAGVQLAAESDQFIIPAEAATQQ